MSPQEFEQALHDAEVKLARLKALYEQWFQGLEKMEPGVARKDLDRALDMLKKNVPRNTALRFRMQQLVARYGTYGIYWSRIARQIEEGTLRRDIQRVQKKRAQSGARTADPVFELDVDVELEDGDLDSEKTDPGIVATPSSPAKTAPKPALAFDESDLDAILGTLAPGADEPKVRSARPLSPFAMGGARPPMVTPAGGASATFGKPKDKPVAPASTVDAPAAMPKPVTPPTAAVPRPMPAVPRPMPAIPKPAPVAAPLKPAAPVAPPKPAPVVAPPKPAPPPSSAELDEGRMRAIYSRYVDARRQNNERTDVRYESLAESVQKMMPKLREKHAGKPIDFEIVLQNGKVGLKPKVGG